MGSGCGSGPEPGEIRAGSLARFSTDTEKLIKADGACPPIYYRYYAYSNRMIKKTHDLDEGVSFLAKSYRARASS